MNGAIPPPPASDPIPPPPPPSSIPPPPSDNGYVPQPLSNPPIPPPPEDEDFGPALQKKASKNGAAKKTPLSIEDLLKKKREADEAAAKPKFLSKKERERIALEKRQKEVEAEKKARELPGTLPNRATNGISNGRTNGHSHVPTGPRSMAPPTGPRSAMRDHERDPPRDHRNNSDRSHHTKHGDKRKNTEDVEANLIKERYMGADQSQSTFSAKKKRKRTTEKKFNFEWNLEEDTSIDYNPIYSEQVEAGFFGRGHLGGMDADEKAREYARALELKGGDKVRAREYLELEKQRREGSRKELMERHWTEKRLEDMRERDWRIFKEDFNIATKGGSIPNPMRDWTESGLPPRILQLVSQVGYHEPTPVQRACIPIALQNRDLIGIAKTGSGKTASFLLPLLVYIERMEPLGEHNRQDGPYALILAPTRELAQQIEIEAKKFATPLGYKCVSIVGGHSIEEQAYQLRDGAEIVIATPGRLVDCIERRVLVLQQCCYVIMDEADRMIDMGFEEPVNKILDALPVTNRKPDDDIAEDTRAMAMSVGNGLRYRQTMMYTATMPAAVERIARKYLARPAHVSIGNIGEAVETVEQRVEFISGEDKRKTRLREILTSGEFAAPIIVFVNIKRNCDAIAREVTKMGFSSVSLHGSKTQEQREASLASLRNGQTEVLVATDLAGRGIDVPDVSLVVNFNMAPSIEQYTHRIGRTGRAGKNGVAITFVSNDDADTLFDLKQMLQKSELSRVPDELRRHEAAQSKRIKGGKGAANIE